MLQICNTNRPEHLSRDWPIFVETTAHGPRNLAARSARTNIAGRSAKASATFRAQSLIPLYFVTYLTFNRISVLHDWRDKLERDESFGGRTLGQRMIAPLSQAGPSAVASLLLHT